MRRRRGPSPGEARLGATGVLLVYNAALRPWLPTDYFVPAVLVGSLVAARVYVSVYGSTY